MMERDSGIKIYRSALIASDPYIAVKKAVYLEENRLMVGGTLYDLSNFNRVMVIGAGKGTALMARAVEDVMGERVDKGVIIVKYGHTTHLDRIRQVEASHPLPDLAGVRGTGEILEMLRKVDDKTLIICLLSGGGSALLVSPANGLTLEDKQITTDLLLKSGATIDELNTVRKHLSKVKGGQLAGMASPATVVTLILSDVIGDRLDVIASGPTVPDRSTFADALNIVTTHNVEDRFPEKVLNHLRAGVNGTVPETPKEGEPCFNNASAFIVGSLRQAIAAAKEIAEEMGFDTEIITDKLQGEARNAARYLADIARRVKRDKKPGKPHCLISGGETTVMVKGTGKGGRNQEMALAFAIEISGSEGITMLSAGTDGTDGPTDATGAVVDGNTVNLANRVGLDPQTYLADNNSYVYFEKLDALTGSDHHIKTGPTGTNVMDIQLILVSDSTVCGHSVPVGNKTEMATNE
ncbi:MAG: glycerate kinase [Thermodesulfovibrio sp.]|nr:glycerate kinase [Thermodesulfovibrio sp.]